MDTCLEMENWLADCLTRMPGDAAGLQVDNLLADISGQVSDALQVACKANAVDVIFCRRGAETDGYAGAGTMLAAPGIYRVIALNDLGCLPNLT